MRTPASVAVGIRAVERLSQVVPPSQIVLLAPSVSTARALNNLIAELFQATSGAYDIRAISPTGLARLIAQANDRVGGHAFPPRIAGRLAARAALASALWSLPLYDLRPANAPYKHVDALERHFADLERHGITPQQYAAFASERQEPASIDGSSARSGLTRAPRRKSASADDALWQRHATLAETYAAWLHAKSGAGVFDAPSLFASALGAVAPASVAASDAGATVAAAALARADAVRAIIHSDIKQLIVVGAEQMQLNTLRLLHGAFGAGAGAGAVNPRAAVAGSSADGSLLAQQTTDTAVAPANCVHCLLESPCYTAASERTSRLIASVAGAANAARQGLPAAAAAASGPFEWRLYDVPTLSSTVAPLISRSVMRFHASSTGAAVAVGEGSAGTTQKAGKPTGLKRQRKKAGAAATADGSPADSADGVSDSGSDSVRDSSGPITPEFAAQLRAVYVQGLPASAPAAAQQAGERMPPFVQCVGLPADVSEADVVIRVLHRLLSQYSSSPLSIAVMCRSNAEAKAVGQRLQDAVVEAREAAAADTATSPGAAEPTAIGRLGRVDIALYSQGKSDLSRVQEVRWLMAFLGLLCRPDDMQLWYVLLTSRVYALPTPLVSTWMRTALKSSTLSSGSSSGAPVEGAAASGALVQEEGPAEVMHRFLAAAAATVGKRKRKAKAGANTAAAPAAQSGIAAEVEEAEIEFEDSDADSAFGVVGLTESVQFSVNVEASTVAAAAVDTVPAAVTASATATASGAAAITISAQPALRSSPVMPAAAEACKRLVDDMKAAEEEYRRTGSVCALLRCFLSRTGMESTLTTPATGAEADAATAVARLLEVIHGLETHAPGRSSLRPVLRRYINQVAGDADAPLSGAPLVYAAVSQALARGKLWYGADAVTVTGDDAEEEDPSELLPAVSAADDALESSDAVVLATDDAAAAAAAAAAEGDGSVEDASDEAPLPVTREPTSEDAVALQAFEQVKRALLSDSTQAAIDALWAAARSSGVSAPVSGAGLAPPLQLLPLTPPPLRPTVLVTTLRRGLEHQVDVVLVTGCSRSAYPGSFMDRDLPLPEGLYTPAAMGILPGQSSSADVTDGSQAAEVFAPRPRDRDAHIEAARDRFRIAMSRARHGLLFFAPAPTPAFPLSAQGQRSVFLDEIFGSAPAALLSAADAVAHAAAAEAAGVLASAPMAPVATSPVIVSPVPSNSVPVTAAPFSISFSAVSDYEWCPMRYKLGRVDRVPQSPSTALQYGGALHAAVAACAQTVATAMLSPLRGIIPPMDTLSSVAAAYVELTADTAVGRELRATAVRNMPTPQDLERMMMEEYARSWIGDLSYNHGAWQASSVLHKPREDDYRRVPLSFARAPSNPPPSLTAADLAAYIDKCVQDFGYDGRQLKALEQVAATAVQRFVAAELEAARAVLATVASTPGAPPPAVGLQDNRIVGIPAVLELRFDVPLNNGVTLIGVIDRVDVVPAAAAAAAGLRMAGSSSGKRKKKGAAAGDEEVAGEAGGNGSSNVPGSLPGSLMPLVREFKTSHQWKKEGSLKLQATKSKQLDVYGIALHSLRPPGGAPGAASYAVQLESIESGDTAPRVVSGREMGDVSAFISRTVVPAIQASRFEATPDEFKCSYCPFNAVCPDAFGRSASLAPQRLAAARKGSRATTQDATAQQLQK